MRDLPLENLDDESYEAWRGHPSTDALIETMRTVRGRVVEMLVNTATSGFTVKPDKTAYAGGQINMLDQLLSIVLGETREKDAGTEEG